MKDQFIKLTNQAGEALTDVARKTTDLVQATRPDPERVESAFSAVKRVGAALVDEAKEMGRELSETKTFRDAAKGAGVGAIAGVPLPVVGPISGAIIGAAAGVYLGQKLGEPAQSIDLHAELLKLDELRQKNILTQSEFDEQKRKLLNAR